MISNLFKLFSGLHYKKFYKQCDPIVTKINQFEEEYQNLTEDELRNKTVEFKKRFQEGETLEDLLPEAFAVVKNGARRMVGRNIEVCGQTLTWDMVHYDVQLIGGIALHRNNIAEMSTGEGKTLVATLPLYLNALTGNNCQLATVNHYLVRRDAEWMGHLYEFLGLTVGYIQNSMNPQQRQEAYNKDITYGTSSEFGFDYLRDNGMANRKEDQVQRDHYYCIVDEADSILIDEARTPLIISGPAQESSEAPFRELRPGVEKLVDIQNKFCNRLASEAKNAMEKDGGKQDSALVKLLQVKLGSPKNKHLLRLMENGAHRKAFEKYELEMSSDFNREKMYDLKEELYFTIDEKQHQADLTEKGRGKLSPDNPDAFILPDLPTLFMELDNQKDLDNEIRQKKKLEAEAFFAKQSEEIHCLSQLLRAYCLYEKDIEYVVQEDKVIIIDENTGRAMPGRRWSEGLHQAVEAKEKVAIEKESKTYATITIQNYFRLYTKLAGMTGTGETDAQEFHDIYKLSVMIVPPHKPCIRKDLNDTIYKTRREKYNAVIHDIKEAYAKKQPVLVGTTSVEASEVLSKMLKKTHIPHSVLNAKFHTEEAYIIARAGQAGSVTIATNMAGRGTDIKLSDEAHDLGGLFVIGTERHESRRIDRQLRGRCSRQGDPGLSKFYVSLEDDLMRLFANAGPISKILEKSLEEGEQLEHPLLNRSIESAQKRVEQQNFSIRKRLLQFDDVFNKQREVIYNLRNDALHYEEPKKVIFEMLSKEIEIKASEATKRNANDLYNFVKWVNTHFPVSLKHEDATNLNTQALQKLVLKIIQEAYKAKENIEKPKELKQIERYTIIRAIDQNWQDHLTEMEDLRRSVGLRGYAQKDPLSEYKSEAYIFFEELMQRIRTEMCTSLFRSASSLENFQQMLNHLSANARTTGPGDHAPSVEDYTKTATLPKVTIKRTEPKVGRNDPCPCGSGKKYKKCCCNQSNA